MTPVDKDIIKRKLAVIVRNIEALGGISQLTILEYEEERFTQ
jgi:hypothetical protein